MADVSASSVVVGGSLAEVVEDDDLAFRPGGCRLDPADKPENIDESCESTLPDTGFGSRKVTDLVDLLVPPLDGFRSIEDGKGRAMSLRQQCEAWSQLHIWNTPSFLTSGLPAMDKIIAQALNKSRDHRQRTAHEFWQQLEGCRHPNTRLGSLV